MELQWPLIVFTTLVEMCIRDSLMAAAPPAGQPAGRAADAGAPAGLAALVGAAANALAALAFAIFLQLSAGSFADVGYYFDPTHPTEAMADAAATVGAQAPLLWLGAVAVGAIVQMCIRDRLATWNNDMRIDLAEKLPSSVRRAGDEGYDASRRSFFSSMKDEAKMCIRDSSHVVVVR